jgi:starch synthase
MHILMVAAENGAIPGAKVGGMGDVLRDVPRALAALGHQVSVLCPAYGQFHHATRARPRGSVAARFRGGRESVDLYALPPSGPGRRVRQWLLEHPLFASCGAGQVYCNDAPDEPFVTDASKFALFCAATAEGLLDGLFGDVDAVHLHDWHAASVAVLLRRHPAYATLGHTRLVFTVHNLAMQGLRPAAGHESSLAAWFPELDVNDSLIDRRYRDCYNPMRAAINLAHRVHVVSPTYAREVCDPHCVQGEGLQQDLAAARDDGRLFGILNGCDYASRVRPVARADLYALAERELLRWMGMGQALRSTHFLALEKLRALRGGAGGGGLLLTAVGRLTDQKLGLLADRLEDGRRVLHHALDQLEADDTLLVLGTGDAQLEALLTRVQGEDPRLLFLCGFSEPLSDAIYAGGDLFLMPSRFEPCGISQMMAMRASQPCLVSRTGGLADTVADGENGFSFAMNAAPGPAMAFLGRLDDALALLRAGGSRRDELCAAAGAARFPWSSAAETYVESLYDVTVA